MCHETQVLRVLANFGVDFDKPNSNGATPCYIAAQEGHIEALQVLCEFKANACTPKLDGFSPVSIMTISPFRKPAADLITSWSIQVYVAAQENHHGALRVLAEMGGLASARLVLFFRIDRLACCPFFRTSEVLTNLPSLSCMHVCACVFVCIVADLDARNADGATPAYIAACHGHVESLQVLHELGANLNLANNNFATPAYIG
jgi:ankyrin repeat protein